MPQTLLARTAPVARPLPTDLGWTLMVIARQVAVFKHLPRLTAAERILDALPMSDGRFALDQHDSLQSILAQLE
ncbi:hypothetical protein [Deinococcus ruber]|uniref:Uncharacterized protein n=1 Tax=Deinococcus ruber TaxID=1848197 RepID=A0A918F7P0_9DEIO|nr:hypothetical protein [Deinococcus ruber]GGR13055.1 hypothetical protein GCM10008957_27510 [Deinococcus ruber]